MYAHVSLAGRNYLANVFTTRWWHTSLLYTHDIQYIQGDWQDEVFSVDTWGEMAARESLSPSATAENRKIVRVRLLFFSKFP